MPPDWTQLQDVMLQNYVLPHLTARAVASLRSTCKAFQAVTDQAPAKCILASLSQHLPPAELPDPEDSVAAQERLRYHAARIRSVLAGNPTKVCSTEVLKAHSFICIHNENIGSGKVLLHTAGGAFVAHMDFILLLYTCGKVTRNMLIWMAQLDLTCKMFLQSCFDQSKVQLSLFTQTYMQHVCSV